MVALGGMIDLDVKTATLSAERVEKYSTQTREVLESHRYDATEFRRWTSRLVSAAQYEPAGRAWLAASYCVLKQARHRATKRGDHTKVFVGPGVKKEAQFWLDCLAHSSGIALFPRVLFPPSDSSDHRVGWFDASASWGMGGAFLVPRGDGYVAYFYVFEWSVMQKRWHVNVLEAVTGHVVSPPPFVTEFGDSNVANASARKNASPDLQIAQVLRHRASYVKDERITTR